jgi:hypothetical protein
MGAGGQTPLPLHPNTVLNRLARKKSSMKTSQNTLELRN